MWQRAGLSQPEAARSEPNERGRKERKENAAKEVREGRREEEKGSGWRGGGNGIRSCGWMEFVSEEPQKAEQQL